MTCGDDLRVALADDSLVHWLVALADLANELERRFSLATWAEKRNSPPTGRLQTHADMWACVYTMTTTSPVVRVARIGASLPDATDRRNPKFHKVTGRSGRADRSSSRNALHGPVRLAQCSAQTGAARPSPVGSGDVAVWWAGSERGAIGEGKRQPAVGMQHKLPVVVVHMMVIPAAQRHQIVQIGVAAVSPPINVMDHAMSEPNGATVDRTGRVQRCQCSPLGR